MTDLLNNFKNTWNFTSLHEMAKIVIKYVAKWLKQFVLLITDTIYTV